MFTIPMTCMKCSMRAMRRAGIHPGMHSPRHVGKGKGVLVEVQVQEVKEYNTPNRLGCRMALGVCPVCGSRVSRLLKAS